MSNLVLDNQLYDYQVTFTGGDNMMQPQQSPWAQYEEEAKSRGLRFLQEASNNLISDPTIQNRLQQGSNMAQSALTGFGNLADTTMNMSPFAPVWRAVKNTSEGSQIRNLDVNKLVQQGTQAANNSLQNYQLAPQRPVPPMGFQRMDSQYQIQGGAKKSRKTSKGNKEIEDIYGSCGCEGSKESKKKAKPKRARSRSRGKKKAKK